MKKKTLEYQLFTFDIDQNTVDYSIYNIYLNDLDQACGSSIKIMTARVEALPLERCGRRRLLFAHTCPACTSYFFFFNL